MDFHSARRMWESNALAEARDPQNTSTSTSTSTSTHPPPTAAPPHTQISPVSAAAPLSHTPSLPPSSAPAPMSPHSPSSNSPPKSPAGLPRVGVRVGSRRAGAALSHEHSLVALATIPHTGDASDYSDVGEYENDREFFVPGVNDTDQRDAWSEASFDHHSQGQPEDEGGVVRQDSNFSRLSAQSWLTVDSAQSVEVERTADGTPLRWTGGVELGGSEGGSAAAGGRRRNVAMLLDRVFPQGEDHDAATLFGIDVDGDLMERMGERAFTELTVFECCALLQAGVSALKKKSFRRFGARRVWLSAECDQLGWTSKKEGVDEDHIKLHKVAKIKSVDRRLAIDVTEGYRISLLFADANEAELCVRALSCLIPLQARIRAPPGVVPPDKEREDYALIDDVFDGRPLREYMAVNNYVVLSSAKGQPRGLGNKLAFSRSEGSFCGLRYVPWKLVPLMLRSQEEVAVLKRLNHPNIVKYHECLQDEERGGNYVIFEYLARGSLMDASVLEGVKTFTEGTAREVMRDVVAGLTYLHRLRIAHGDVRPDNILRSVDGTVKVNALGCITHDFTEIQDIPSLAQARLGDASPAFLAPELCWLCEGPQAHAKSYAMDVWAVGAVLYFMLYGRVPFGGRTDAEIQESICRGKLRFPRHPETSRKVRGLLKGILGEKDPKTRIALTELENHPWFTETEGNQAKGSAAGKVGKPGKAQDVIRLIVSPAEVDSAVQVAKIRVGTKKS